MATRFTTDQCLLIERPQGGFTDYQLCWRKEFVDSLIAVRPIYIITAMGPDSTDVNSFLKEPTEIALREIPGFDSLLRTNYSLDTVIGWWYLYRRSVR
jgi:hypothetical protein